MIEFSKNDVVRSNKLDKIMEFKDLEFTTAYRDSWIDSTRLLEFCRVMSNSPVDISILEVWEGLFKDHDLPYAITEQNNEIILWKERVA